MKKGPFKTKLDSYYPWFFLAVFLLLWQFAVEYFKIPTYILPTPLVIISKGVEIWPTLVRHTLVTLKEIFLGFVIGSLLGAFLAFFISYFSLARKIFLPYIIAFQTMPKLGLAPLFIIWFGFGFFTNVTIVTSISFFPILVNFFTGLDQFNENEERLMASYNASKNQIYFHVRLFRALPFLFAGFQLGIILSVTGAIVAEFIAGNEGLGYLTILANNTLETPMMFCALLLLGIIGFILYHIVDFMQKILMPWAARTETLTGPESGL
ncbi:MAG: ABC transporter permease [Pseudomonadota bacterium]